MTPISWSLQALRDVESIREYIAQDSPRMLGLAEALARLERYGESAEACAAIAPVLDLKGTLSPRRSCTAAILMTPSRCRQTTRNDLTMTSRISGSPRSGTTRPDSRKAQRRSSARKR